MKKITIPSYANGYKAGNTSCMHLPVAAAAGSFEYENYYKYSFIFAIMANYGDIYKMDYETGCNQILNNIGLEMQTKKVENNHLIHNVMKYINLNIPLIWIVNYSTLFYLWDHYEYVNASHSLIISGYDDTNRVIIVNEHLLTRDLVDKYYKGHPFISFSITYDMFLDIWMKNNTLKSQKNYKEKIYCIIPNNEKLNVTYLMIAKDFLNKYYNEESDFIRYMHQMISKEITIDNVNIEFVRRTFFNTWEVIFDCLEKAVSEVDDHVNILLELKKIKEHFMKKLDYIINILHVNLLRDNLGSDVVEKCVLQFSEIELLIKNFLFYSF